MSDFHSENISIAMGGDALKQTVVAVGIDSSQDINRVVFLQRSRKRHWTRTHRNGLPVHTVKGFEYVFDIRDGKFFQANAFISKGHLKTVMQPIGIGYAASTLLDIFRLKDKRSQEVIDFLVNELGIDESKLREGGLKQIHSALDNWFEMGKPRFIEDAMPKRGTSSVIDSSPSIIRMPQDLTSRLITNRANDAHSL